MYKGQDLWQLMEAAKLWWYLVMDGTITTKIPPPNQPSWHRLFLDAGSFTENVDYKNKIKKQNQTKPCSGVYAKFALCSWELNF